MAWRDNRVGGSRRRSAAAFILPFIMACACSNDNPLPGAAPRRVIGERVAWPIQQKAPVVVQITSDSMSMATLAEATSTLVLGSGVGGETDEFGTVSGVAVDKHEKIFVLDGSGYRVRVYDGSGHFIRDIGRRGQGPGEFFKPHGDPSQLATAGGIALSHDTLFVLDDELEAFDTSGVFLGGSRLAQNFESSVSASAAEDGLILGLHPFEKPTVARLAFALYDARGGVADSFSVIENYSDYGVNLYRPPVPLPRTPYAVAPNGRIYFAVGDTFHIDVYRVNGKIEKSYVSTPERIRFSSADLKDFVESDVRFVQDRVDQALKKAVALSIPKNIAKVDHSRYREAISALIVSARGTILIRRSDLTQRPYYRYGPKATATWTMLDSVGHPLATTLLPISYAPYVFVGCNVYGAQEAEDGSHLVVRFHIKVPGNNGC